MPVPEASSQAPQFIALVLQSRHDPARLREIEYLIRNNAFSWEGVLRFTRQAALGPLFYHTLRDSNPAFLPPAVMEAWRQDYYHNAARTAFIEGELERLLILFQQQDIPVILLKGAALAFTLYGNPTLRPMMDVDLLVPPEQASAAIRLLESAGYDDNHNEPHIGLTLAYESQIRFVRRELTPLLLELHWHLLDVPYYQYRLPLRWFRQSARPFSIGAASACGFGPEAQLLHLAMHMILHHRTVTWMGMQDVAEIIHHYHGTLDWQQILARARQYELLLPVRRVFLATSRTLHPPIPPSFLVKLQALAPSPREIRLNAWLTASPSVARRFLIDLAGIPRWRQRWRFAWQHLLPSPSYMRQRYGLRSPWLIPLLYPYRWLHGLRKTRL